MDSLRLCYLVPAHHLLATAGPSRNVLSLAGALVAEGARVTVAVRRVIAAEVPAGVRVVELDPTAPLDADPPDDSAMRGLGVAEFARYLGRIHAFLARAAADCDVFLEKTWLLSGTLSRRAFALGRAGLPVENFVPDPARHAGGACKRLRLGLARRLAGRALRGLPRILVETPELADAFVRAYGVARERLVVVPPGVDRERFRPRPQAEARAALGLDPAACILLYVGVLDATHDLRPLLEALAALGDARPAGLRLHLVGEGPQRGVLETFARVHRLPVRFHGRRPHAEIPLWIAAADLCLAPYRREVFANRELGYATMKIPEYLAVGRPVVSVPSGRARALIRHGESGFLFDNRSELWQTFLRDLPGRERLAAMGAMAARVPLPDWRESARACLGVCRELLVRRREAA